MLGVVETDVRPSLAAVRGFVNAVAVADVAAQARLARAGVNDIWIRWRDGDSADGLHGLLVKERFPVLAGVFGFPNASVNGTEIVGVGSGKAFDGLDTASTKWANQAPLERAESFGVELLRAHCRRKRKKRCKRQRAKNNCKRKVSAIHCYDLL